MQTMIERLKQMPIKPVKVNGKLILATVITLLVLSVAMLSVTVLNSVVSEANLLHGYLESLPRILNERSDDLLKTYSIFFEDCEARGDTGTLLYGMSELTEGEGGENVSDAELIEAIRDTIQAQDISLIDSKGTILESTRGKSSAQLLPSDIEWVLSSDKGMVDLNTRPQSATDNVEAAQGENTAQGASSTDATSGDSDDSSKTESLLYCAQVGENKFILIEFDFGSYSETYKKLGLWDNLLDRLLSGFNAYAFAVFEEGPGAIYPSENLSEEQLSSLATTASNVAALEGGIYLPLAFEGDLDGTLYGITSLLDDPALVGMVYLPDEKATVIIAVPLDNFTAGTFLCCVVSLIFLACSLIFLTIYVRKSIAQRQLQSVGWKARKREARRRCLPGFIIVLVVLACLTLMLQGLEGMSITASATKSQREALENEISYHETLVEQSYNYYMDRTITRANALARLLNDYPLLQNREILRELAEVSGADYLMLFDKTGNETMSSNSLTGFHVSDSKDDPSNAYKSVLLGYPYAITEITKDDLTGTFHHTVASLMTDEEGFPNGFLLVSFDDTLLQDQMKDSTTNSVVNSFATQVNQVAMAVDPESKLFIAHTDPEMVGQLATDYLDEAILGHNFEGFSRYAGADSYVSEAMIGETDAKDAKGAEAAEGKTSIMIATNNGANLGLTVVSIVLLQVFMLIALVVDYFIIVRVCTRAAGTEESENKRQKSPLSIFAYGYVALFGIFGIFALVQAAEGGWPAFSFVFSGEWSKGVNLFSLWMAIFIFAAILAIAFVLRLLLKAAGKRVSPQTKTFTRLGDSIVTYGAVIAILVYVLAMFGVNTTAILASAGIGAIAIGMGAKDLIGDILAGVFIIFEGSIHVGDIVEIGGWRGRVTDMGIRTCEITNDHNDVKIITNNRINEIVNLSRKQTVCTADFEIPRDADFDNLGELADGYIAAVVAEIPELKDNLNYEGMISFDDKNYTVRLRYQCNEAEREALTVRLKTVFQMILEKGVTPEAVAADAADRDES